MLGPIIRTIRGLHENLKLDGRKARLEDLTKDGPLSLVPESFRSCAELRLRVAECQIADGSDRRQLEADAVRRFEEIRTRGLEAMMNQASTQSVTRDEMARVVHTLDQYARAAQAEIEQAEDRSRQALAPINEKLKQQERSLGSLEQQVKSQSDAVRRLAELTEQATRAGKECTSALQALQASTDRNSARLVWLGVLSVLQWGCIIYLLVR